MYCYYKFLYTCLPILTCVLTYLMCTCMHGFAHAQFWSRPHVTVVIILVHCRLVMDITHTYVHNFLNYDTEELQNLKK